MLSSSSSYRGVWPLVDPFRSHTSKSLFWFLLLLDVQFFIILGNGLRGILLTRRVIFSCILPKTGVIFNSFANLNLFYNLSKYILLFFLYILSWQFVNVCSKRLRWSRGSVLAFGTQIRGFKPGRSRRIFQGEKILSTPFVPCKRSLNVTWKSGIFRQNSSAISRPSSSSFHY